MDKRMFPPGSRVLVTGASGFLGSHVCRRLAEEGVQHIAVSQRPAAAPAAHCHRLQCDLTSWPDTQHMIAEAQPTHVIHLAGYADARRQLVHVLPALHGNLTATVNLLTALAEIGCTRIVLPGTFESPTAGQPPTSAYAAAKAAAAIFAELFEHRYGLPLVTARIFMTYGPGQSGQKLIPYVVRSLLAGESPRLGDGARPVDWIYVDDVVEGLLALSLAPGIEGGTFDLGSGRLVAIRHVVEQLAALLDSLLPIHFGELADRGEEVIATADVVTTTAATGWRPATPLEIGLRRTIEALRAEVDAGQLQFTTH